MNIHIKELRLPHRCTTMVKKLQGMVSSIKKSSKKLSLEVFLSLPR